ncbi:dipeptidyl aminopeptidase B, partial [Phenoliferia sp. Uapishka_3]
MKQQRRSLSDIIFPPRLALPIVDPFSSYQPPPDEDESDASSLDAGDDGYRDDFDSREEKGLLEEEGGGSSVAHWKGRAVHSKRRWLLVALFPAALGLILFTTFLGSHVFSGRHTFHGKGLKPISLAHIANGTFAVERQYLNWLPEAGDGVYSYQNDDGTIVLRDVATNSSRVLVRGEDVKDQDGQQLLWYEFKVSADLKYILFDTDYQKQWRHSSHANWHVYNLLSGETTPLRQPSYPPHTAIASFSPANHHIAYVHANDLYVLDQPPVPGDNDESIRVTFDGSPTTFNGVPDWVYEEEVFEGDSATWWAPDGNKLAYLSFDEQDVPEYEFPIYNPSHSAPGGLPYPESTVMRYPKPGFPNPKVQIHVFDLLKYSSLPLPGVIDTITGEDSRLAASTYRLTFSTPFAPEDTIITQVSWVGKDDLIIKATNRIASIQRVAHFSIGLLQEEEGDIEIVGEVVREDDYEKIDGGWVEPGQTVVGIDSSVLLHSHVSADSAPLPSHPPGYLDIVPNSDGYPHIAYFSPPESSTPVFLTSGDWEVAGTIEAVDVSRGLVYFIAANPSIERHLYSVPLPSAATFAALKAGTAPTPPTILTNTTAPGFHSTSFSPFGSFYVLNYNGPDIPWQRLVKVEDKNFIDVLSDNAALAKVEEQFLKVDVSYTTVKSHGHDLNVLEMRPPFMDLSGRTKYPILVSVYGGPNSQKVQTTFQRDWHHFLCTSLNYVIIFVDPRGTGAKGRKFRMPVRDRLGVFEAEDVTEATRHYIALPYIDEKRVGIWGWSYGGYLTNKALEKNSTVFTLGVAVAPVTDWAYYDSIYTERYMSTPELNPQGYANSSVTDMAGFQNVDFLLAHGSGDDNVHFLNTAVLLDRLTMAHVRKFRFRMFTDSDHSMSMRGAYWELMNWISDFLVEKWGEGGRTKQHWKMTAHQIE